MGTNHLELFLGKTKEISLTLRIKIDLAACFNFL